MGYEKQLVKGAIVNLFGVVPKLAYPLILFVIPWLFGTDVMGLYFLVVFLVDILNYLVYSGYCDATSIFASRQVDIGNTSHQKALYRIFANAFAIPTSVGLLLVLIGLVAIDPFITAVYPGKNELVGALQILMWTIPLLSLSSMCIASTRALMIMKYDVAINSTLYPLLLLFFIICAGQLNMGLTGLMIARLITQAIVLLLSLWAFGQHFSLRRTFREILRLKIDYDMLRFALPQNLNMTLNRYISRIDVLMLGAFGFSNHVVAFYSAGVLITSNVREIKQIFTSILGPIIVRHHSTGSSASMSEDLSMVVRWVITIAIPIITTILILRNDLLLLLDNDFAGNALFMAILLIAPLFDCAVGMAGNCIVWTGHSSWNLFNSILVSIINTLLNILLIPLYGLNGAAIATVTAIAIVSVAQLIELYYLERTSIYFGAVYKPWIGFTLCILPIIVIGDPAQIADIWMRVALATGLILFFFLLMLRLSHPEVVTIMRRAKYTAGLLQKSKR